MSRSTSDTPPFNALGFSPTGEPAFFYYHLDVQSTTPAPVYTLYHEDEDKPVAEPNLTLSTRYQVRRATTIFGRFRKLGAKRLCREHDYGRVDSPASRLQDGKDG